MNPIDSLALGNPVHATRSHAVPALLAVLLLWPALLRSQVLPVPNGSFEFPTTVFADPRIDSWQKSPKPGWYDESGGFPWDQLVGVFLNTTPDKPDHIVNIVGQQAAFLFAVPQAAIFQDRGSTPGHDLDVRFEVGRAYELTVGVLGGGGGMTNGVTLEISLYYRDAAGLPVAVAATTVTNELSLFANRTRFTDFSVRVPAVRAGDAWAGKNLGIQIASTVQPDIAGGYWDVEDVRLSREIVVPNASFESPSTVFADPRIDSWQRDPKPDWYDESGGFPWEQLAGVFLNTAPGAADHIENMVGTQGTFIFAVPQYALFQERDSTPSRDFDVHFETGRSYRLTAGILGGGGGMTNGVTLELALYYRDALGNRVTVTSATIINTTEAFPTRNRFTDYHLQTPLVGPTDPWAGRNLGISIASTVRPDLAGGYWDVDDVRLTETRGVVLLNPVRSATEFTLTVMSDPGSVFEIQAANSVVAPSTEWLRVGSMTNVSGRVKFTDAAPPGETRFYRAQQLP